MNSLEDDLGEAGARFIGRSKTDELIAEISAHDGDTIVADPEAPTSPVEPKKKPEEKEDVEEIFKRARKPPADGPCRGCGKNAPLNRLMLCFPCWVKKNLLEDAKLGKNPDWIPGDPHPSYCGCNLPEHGGGPRK